MNVVFNKSIKLMLLLALCLNIQVLYAQEDPDDPAVEEPDVEDENDYLSFVIHEIGPESDANGALPGTSSSFSDCGNIKLTYDEFLVQTGPPASTSRALGEVTGTHAVGTRASTMIAPTSRATIDNNSWVRNRNVRQWKDYAVVHIAVDVEDSADQCFYPRNSIAIGDMDGISTNGTREIGAIVAFNEDEYIPLTGDGTNSNNNNVRRGKNIWPFTQAEIVTKPSQDFSHTDLANWPDYVTTGIGARLQRTNPNNYDGNLNLWDGRGLMRAYFKADQCITDVYFLYGIDLPASNATVAQSSTIQIKGGCVTDYGDAPSTYGPGDVDPVTGSDDAVAHFNTNYTRPANETIRLGSRISAEQVTRGTNAESDSLDDGVLQANLIPTRGISAGLEDAYTVADIKVTNTTDEDVLLCGWVDFDMAGQSDSEGKGDGTFDDDEKSCVTVVNKTTTDDCTYNNDNTTYTCSLTWDIPEDFVNVETEDTYARFRVVSTETNQTQATTRTTEDNVISTGKMLGGEVEDYLIPANTLPVTLSGFKSKRYGDRIRVDWQTQSEMFNAGFNVWVKQKGIWSQLSTTMTPGAMESISQKTYRRWFKLNKTQRQNPIEALGITSVSSYGKEEFYGPYTLNKAYGYQDNAPEPIDWDEISKAMDKNLSSRGFIKVGDNWVRGNSKRGKELKAEAKGDAVLAQFRLDKAGMVEVSHSDLLAQGVDLTGQLGNRIMLTDNGEGLQRRVNGLDDKGNWTANSSIVFYSQGLDGLSANETARVYRLSLGRGEAYGMKTINTELSSDVTDTAEVRQFEENQKEYLITSQGDDPWLGQYMYNYSGQSSGDKLYTMSLGNVSDKEAAVTLNYQGYYDDPKINVDSKIEAFVRTSSGDVVIGHEDVKGTGDNQVTFTVPAGVLTSGDNKIGFRLLNIEEEGWKYSIIYVDNVELSYQESLSNIAGHKTFYSNDDSTNNYDVSGITGDYEAYAILARGGVVNIKAEDGQLKKLGNEYGEVRYELVKDNGYLTAQVEKVDAQAASRISSEGADYLIISHALFTDSFENGTGKSFIEAKQSQGLTVKVVDYSDVVQSVGEGYRSGEVLSKYIAQEKATNNNLTYVLLAGSACRDVRNYSGKGCIDMVPTKYVKSGSYTKTPSDFLLGDVDEDGYADVMVGRFAARTLEDLDNMLVKQSRTDSDIKVLLTAEKSESTASGSGLDFKAQQERLGALLPETYQVEGVYEDDGKLSQDIINGLNEGADIWSYSGHSSTAYLGARKYTLTYKDLLNLSNDKKPLGFPLACYFTYSVEETVNTMAHRLMSEEHGFKGVFGSSIQTNYNSNEALQSRVLDKMANESMTLGESILASQYVLGKSNATLQGANLLGDPAQDLTSFVNVSKGGEAATTTADEAQTSAQVSEPKSAQAGESETSASSQSQASTTQDSDAQTIVDVDETAPAQAKRISLFIDSDVLSTASKEMQAYVSQNYNVIAYKTFTAEVVKSLSQQLSSTDKLIYFISGKNTKTEAKRLKNLKQNLGKTVNKGNAQRVQFVSVNQFKDMLSTEISNKIAKLD